MSVSAIFGTGLAVVRQTRSFPTSFSGGCAPLKATPPPRVGASGGGLVIESSSRPQKKATAHHRKSRPKKTQPWDIKRGPTVYPPLPELPPEWTLVTDTEEVTTTVVAAEAVVSSACKYLRRRCPSDCIFSPYFPSNNAHRFACVHRIYGASNIGKMLQQLPVHLRADAADSLYYEAQCRIENPVYGCVGIITSLHQQIYNAQTELAKAQADIAFCYSSQESGGGQVPQYVQQQQQQHLDNDATNFINSVLPEQNVVDESGFIVPSSSTRFY